VDRQIPGTDDAYFELLRGLGARADAIWGTCVGYPGHEDRHGFLRFFRERSLAAEYVFAAESGGTVGEITAAVGLRRRASELAAQTQDLSDTELQRRFRRSFPELVADPGLARQSLAGQRVLVGRARRRLDLHDIQGFVLNRYGLHEAATHLFLRIASAPAARRWLARQAVAVTSVAAAQATPSQRALHLAVSHPGLARLGVPTAELDAFPDEFRQGMYEREDGLSAGRGVQTWRHPFERSGATDVLVLLSAPSRKELDSWVGEVRRELEASGGFEIRGEQRGDRIRAEPGAPNRFREHFGFADGLARPGVEDHDRGTVNDVLPPGEFILGYRDVDDDTAGRGMPAALANNGSFLVYRKLEQHVAAFRRLTAAQAHRFPYGGTQAGAKLVGRWPDGTPVTHSPSHPDPELATDSAFDYAGDADGGNCPVGAHVRRGNPRDALPGGKALTRRHHMLRRGIPYGPVLSSDARDDDDAERGLLFLAVMSDIGRQFEFVQTEWMADGNVFGLGRQQDVFTTGGGPGARMTVQGKPPAFVSLPEPLVTCRGGDYFFLPGIEALHALGTSAVNDRRSS
jgi:Dyp-type peroxidase family